MFGSFFKPFYYIIGILVILVIFITCFFTPLYANSNIQQQPNSGIQIQIGTSGFVWPIPGYTTITSPFGRRNSPTAGASTYHKGIDIGAPEGTMLIAATDGIITYAGFLGGGGFTITLSKENLKITYCHISPQFMVKEGEKIHKGQIIAQVGPKYVYNVIGNTYHDSQGRPTNGAITGTHLHFGIRINDQYVNPLNYY